MNFSDLSINELLQLAKSEGLKYNIGPFNVSLKTNICELVQTYAMLYQSLPLLPSKNIFDFHITVDKPLGIRGHLHPQAIFSLDGVKPFEPYPLTHAFPLSEWGLNWCIGLSAHQNLMLHAAIVEYNGKALIMPATPGSGKSTLSAGMMLRGWRLLSDEFGLINLENNQLIPLPRAIPLKNESIQVIKNFDDNVILGPTYPGTRKGDVAHVAPTVVSLNHQSKESVPTLIVFPKYNPEVRCKLEKKLKSEAFTSLTMNSFNYYLSQKSGFDSLTHIVKNCDSYTLEFNDMESAINLLTELIEGKTRDSDE